MIGYTPQQIDDMSLWQIACAVEGYRAAHEPSDGAPAAMTPDEFDALKTKFGIA